MEQILVAMKKRDRIQEIVPILKKMAEPGMKVTFLFSYPVDAWAWLGHHWVVTESTRGAVSEVKKLAAKYSWEEQKQLAEQKISLARETLGKMGVEVASALTGCWRRALRDTMLNPDFQLILMSAANGSTTVELARLLTLLLRPIKRSNFPFFVLHQPQRAAHSSARGQPS
jgi:hypothetical protein